jgi:hypothetical protein
MADGRMVNRSVATDERLNGLSTESMLLFLMTVPHLDRDGLIDGRPRVLWALVAPLQDAWIQTAPALIEEWLAAGLATSYSDASGKAVLHFAGFTKNQKLIYHREKPSRYGCPPGYVRTNGGLLTEAECARRDHDEVMQNSRPRRAQSGGMEHGARDEVMQNARPRRAQSASRDDSARDEVMPQYQDQDQSEVEVEVDGGGDHPISLTHISAGGSGEGGDAAPHAAGNGAAAAADLVYLFTDQQLRTGCYQLGSLLGLHAQWNSFEAWLARQPPPTLVILLEWIQWYAEMPASALERIDNLVGVIRSHINKGERAPVTSVQRTRLAEQMEMAITVGVGM